MRGRLESVPAPVKRWYHPFDAEPTMKTRSHLVLLVLGAVLPVLAFSAVMGVVFWRQQRAAFEQRFLERVRAMAVALDRELEASIRALEALSGTREVDDGDLEAFAERARRMREAEPT